MPLTTGPNIETVRRNFTARLWRVFPRAVLLRNPRAVDHGGVNRQALVVASLVVALGCGSDEGAKPPAGTEPDSVETRTIAYQCEGGQTIRARYLAVDGGAVTFVVLRWNGQTYGLAPAVSASGARFAGLFGPAVSDRGLEWWEARGEAMLSMFTGKDFSDTRPLVTACRPTS